MHSTRSVYMHYFMLPQRDDPTTDRPTVTLLCPSIGGLCTCSLLHSSLTQAFIESIAYLYKYIAIKSTYHSTCTQCHIISSVAGNSTVEPPPPPPLWIYRPNLTDRLTAIHDRWWWGFSRQFVYHFRFEPWINCPSAFFYTNIEKDDYTFTCRWMSVCGKVCI